uniref:CDT1 Geminin-binding domain-containing protein n=1 Tax=Chenopodium quinoa TaxID=63459 RepID=A0A803KY67_CHEQI
MESQPSDSLKMPEKTSPAEKPLLSDQISSRTPTKLPHPPQRFKLHRRSVRLPEKYETLLKFFDALDASLKLLRLRNSIPLFGKIRLMIENMSERRFTHQHLAQLKFLLPEEIGIRKVLMADEETRCMEHDLHLSLTINRTTREDKRKRGSKNPCLRDLFISKLLDFARDHPEGTDIPEESLPESFNQKKHDLLLRSFKQSSASSRIQKFASVAESDAAQATHFSPSFRKHFSMGGSYSKSRNSLQSPSDFSDQLQSMYSSNPSLDRDEVESVTLQPETVSCRLPAGQIKRKPFVDSEICSAHSAKMKQGTPMKHADTPIKPATPTLQTPKRFRLSADKSSDLPSCARSLKFEGPSGSVNIDLQVDDVECSNNISDILPENLLQSNPKFSAIKKEALIRNLTECHLDITDESEIEEQLKLLQEFIPEWVVCSRLFSCSSSKLLLKLAVLPKSRLLDFAINMRRLVKKARIPSGLL